MIESSEGFHIFPVGQKDTVERHCTGYRPLMISRS